MRKITAIGAAAAAALTMGMLAACGAAASQPPPSASAQGQASATSPAPATNPAPATGTESATATGEIWQWALGRDVWSDPALQPYTHNLGRTMDTDANVQSRGFQLTPDSSGTVTSVTLYNDENDLGYPGSETNFSAYQGSLPLELSWDDTATEVSQTLGSGSRSGGYGTDITFTYVTDDGYRVEVGFAARHDADLPDSPIHYIRVSQA